MSRQHHTTLGLDYLLGMPDDELRGALVCSSGEPLTVAEIRGHLRALKARGFEVMPACENHNAKGYCLGHKMPTRAEPPLAAASRQSRLPLTPIECERCRNEWFVFARPEFNPVFCTYCGLKFHGFEKNGSRFKQNGQPLGPDAEGVPA